MGGGRFRLPAHLAIYTPPTTLRDQDARPVGAEQGLSPIVVSALLTNLLFALVAGAERPAMPWKERR